MGANFDVTAILKANVSDFSRGLKEAQTSIQSLKQQTGSSFEKIGNSLSMVGMSAMKLGAGLTAGLTTPVVGAVGGVVKSFADLEQSLGGVQTLFKQNGTSVNNLAKEYGMTREEAQRLYKTMADEGTNVIENANRAFKTAGVSANSYMEQVTSFSATLLQGLGGDTAKAAQYADKALVQMADNANKMGTNMADIQNAYQGFAKDNYTMLDNLKLGYGGTASEMARLVNESGVLNGEFEATAENVKDIPFHTLIEAIGITQDRLGITGTTAKEASETVSGSFQAMKAAAENLVAGLGNNEADIKTLMENMKDTILTFKDNVVRVLGTIWDNLPLAPWQKWLGLILVSAGPVLTVIGGVAAGIGKLISIITFLGGVFSKVSAWFTLLNSGGSALSLTFAKIVGVVSSLGAPLLVVIGIIAGLIAILVGVYNTSEEFRNKVNSAFEAVKTAITSAIQEAVSFVTEIWGTLVSWWSENHELIESVATKVWNAIKMVVETVMNVLAPFIEVTWNNIVAVIQFAWDVIKSVVEIGINLILGIIKTVMQIINGDWSGAWEIIKETAGKVWEGIKNLVDVSIKGLLNIVTVGWNGIKSTISSTIEIIKSVVSIGWNSLVSTVTNAGPRIVSAVRNGFNNAVNAARNFISSAISVGRNLIMGFVDGVKSAAGALIDAVGGAVQGAIDWAKGLLGIHSPSRVFRQFGVYTDEGFILGVNSKAGAVVKSVGNMAQGAIDAFTGKDLAGSLQNELGAVDGELGRLTVYDPSVDFNGGTITVGQQAADIVLKMGNTVFRAFTEDITNAQEMELILSNY
jgi:tail tape measure protein